MSKINFIKTSADYSLIKKKGHKLVCEPFVILYIKDDLLKESIRIGIIVSSKIGGAVIRNKTKRRLKNMLIEVLKSSNYQGFSLCMIARSRAYDFCFEKMKGVFSNALEKISR